MEKSRNVYKASIELSDGTSEDYFITAGGMGGADRILSKYTRDNKIQVVTINIIKLDGQKAQTDRTRLYSTNKELLLEAPDGNIVKGFNWRDIS